MYCCSITGNPAQRTEEIKKVEELGAAPIVYLPFLNRGEALPVGCLSRLHGRVQPFHLEGQAKAVQKAQITVSHPLSGLLCISGTNFTAEERRRKR